MKVSNSSNRDVFIPTFLYVKRCNHCGLRYFGKTTRDDPHTYLGSGVYWRKHCSKYGWEHVTTVKVKLFTSKLAIAKSALEFSVKHDIVNARLPSGKKAWANMKHEDGLDGGSVPGTLHKRARNKMSSAKQGLKYYYDQETQVGYRLLPNDSRILELGLSRGRPDATLDRLSVLHLGKPKPLDAVAKMAKSRKGQRPYNDGVNFFLMRKGDKRIVEWGLRPGYPEERAAQTRGKLNGMYGLTHTQEVRDVLSTYAREQCGRMNAMDSPEARAKMSAIRKLNNPSRGKKPYNDGVNSFFLDPKDPKIKKRKLIPGVVRCWFYFRDRLNSYHYRMKKDDPKIKKLKLVMCKDQSTCGKFRPGHRDYSGEVIL